MQNSAKSVREVFKVNLHRECIKKKIKAKFKLNLLFGNVPLSKLHNYD